MSIMRAVSSGTRKDRILDAAEKLFSLKGFDGVTLRQVAEEADVDLALASYHFGNKNGLFDAVLLRRAEVMNEVRLEALDECIKAAGGNPTIEDLMDSALKPIFDPDEELSEGWRNYYRLIAYVNSSGTWGELAMSKYFDTVLTRYLEEWKKALPWKNEEDLYWSYHYFSGALTLTMAQTGRIDHYSDGRCHSTDLDEAYKRMVKFSVAGFTALAKG